LFAEGVVVTAVDVENIEPGDIPVNDGFDGVTDLAIASATLDPGTSHSYRVAVTADVSAVSTVEAALDCDLDQGEDGTGFLNRATVNPSADDCAVIQLLPSELPPTGLRIDPMLLVAAALLGGGLVLYGWAGNAEPGLVEHAIRLGGATFHARTRSRCRAECL
jgi:hypothetical protein